MHIAAVCETERRLLPELRALAEEIRRLERENQGIIKTGRTHLQDATPIALSQEMSGWRAMLDKCAEMIERSLEGVRELALGGTAVGTASMRPPALTEWWRRR